MAREAPPRPKDSRQHRAPHPRPTKDEPRRPRLPSWADSGTHVHGKHCQSRRDLQSRGEQGWDHPLHTLKAPQIQLSKPTYSQCLQSRGLRPSTQALGGQAWPEEPLQEQHSGQAGPRRDLGERWGVRREPLWLWTQHCSEQCFLRACQGQSSLPSSYFVTCHRQWPA